MSTNNLHYQKMTLREKAADLHESNKIERQAYRDALAGLDEDEQDKILAMADRLAAKIKLRNPRAQVGTTMMLELLANLAPFVGGGE